MASIKLLACCLRVATMKDTILGISVCFQCLHKNQEVQKHFYYADKQQMEIKFY